MAIKKRNFVFLFCFLVFCIIVVGCSQEAPTPIPKQDPNKEPITAMYVGSDSCKGCHKKTYEGFVMTRHFTTFKPLEKYDIDLPDQITVFDTANQQSPVSVTLDISNISGVMADKYVVAQVPVAAGFQNDFYRVASLKKEGDRWKLQPAKTGDFDNDGTEDWGAAAYSCGTCHSPNLGKIQDEGTIGCESCHGPGGNHVQTANKEGTMTVSQESCYTCHNSNPKQNDQGVWIANNHYGTRNYFASKHAQSEATNDCLTCHTPHTVNKDGKTVIGDDPANNCQKCHAQDMDLNKLMWVNPTDPTGHFTKDHSFGAMPYNELGDKKDSEEIEITNPDMIKIIEQQMPKQESK